MTVNKQVIQETKQTSIEIWKQNRKM